MCAAVAGLLLGALGSEALADSPSWWDTGLGDRIPRRRIILTYTSAEYPVWTPDRFLPYVTYVSAEGAPQDWFFDTFLVLAYTAPSGRSLCPGFGTGPATLEDWRSYVDHRLFGGPGYVDERLWAQPGELGHLNEAVRIAGRALGEPNRRVRVLLALPYPHPDAESFGSLEGRPLDLSQQEDRLEALRWYVDYSLRRWVESRFDHLVLGGFYWIHEEVRPGDRALIPEVSALVRRRLLPLFWIPWFDAPGVREWRSLGFHFALHQPNFYFYEVPPERLGEAAEIARRYHMGVELELDRRVLESEEHRLRYRRYLEAGVEFGYIAAGQLGWYDDRALLECSRSGRPEARAIYEETYRFVRGVWRPAP